MSQAKVDRKKEIRKNREAVARKNKLHERIAWMITGVIGLAIIAWLAFSLYQKIDEYEASKPIDYKYYEADTSAVNEYVDDVATAAEEGSEAEVTEEAVTEETTEATAETTAETPAAQ